MTISHTVLSSLAAMVAGGSVTILTQVGMPPADLVNVPWDKLLGVGSGGLAFGVAWYFLQREERARLANESTVQKHLEATAAISRTFAETTQNMVREFRDEAEKREARMLQLMSKHIA